VATHGVTIGRRKVGPEEPVFVIAEIGMNHNGSLDLAKALVLAAAAAGADAVKFQTFRTERFYARSFPDLAERRKYELSPEAHRALKALADELGVEFFSTPLDAGSADLLDELGVPCFKVASCDLNNYPFLKYLACKGKPILLSTGYSTLAEVDRAVETIHSTGNRQLVLLHCVAMYPTDLAFANVRAVETLRRCFQVPVGLSDHSTDSPVAAISAVTLGACVLEKHFTLDRKLPGYDHAFSETPASLKALIAQVRDTERALGDGLKRPQEPEFKRRTNARRSLYWSGSYPPGTPIREEMLIPMRPGVGLPPETMELLVGRMLCAAVEDGELARFAQVEWEADAGQVLRKSA
jgi:N-acetylneuraminate synthase/N,N'-diacetyllegionaminate synthase